MPALYYLAVVTVLIAQVTMSAIVVRAYGEGQEERQKKALSGAVVTAVSLTLLLQMMLSLLLSLGMSSD